MVRDLCMERDRATGGVWGVRVRITDVRRSHTCTARHVLSRPVTSRPVPPRRAAVVRARGRDRHPDVPVLSFLSEHEDLTDGPPAEGTLGSGRFSVVYHRRTPSGRDVALKRVRRPSYQTSGKARGSQRTCAGTNIRAHAVCCALSAYAEDWTSSQ